MRCPYVENKVYCTRRETDDEESKYACDSCYVLWGDYWDTEEMKQ